MNKELKAVLTKWNQLLAQTTKVTIANRWQQALLLEEVDSNPEKYGEDGFVILVDLLGLKELKIRRSLLVARNLTQEIIDLATDLSEVSKVNWATLETVARINDTAKQKELLNSWSKRGCSPHKAAKEVTALLSSDRSLAACRVYDRTALESVKQLNRRSKRLVDTLREFAVSDFNKELAKWTDAKPDKVQRMYSHLMDTRDALTNVLAEAGTRLSYVSSAIRRVELLVDQHFSDHAFAEEVEYEVIETADV